MKIFSAQQIRAWDAYTIANEPITSLGLMERAAQACTAWLVQHYPAQKTFKIFCGKGNNGGDGLAIARQLHQKGFQTFVYILESSKLGSADFQANLQQLHGLPITVQFIQSEAHFPDLQNEDLIIDALYGSGLNNPLDGLSAALVQHLNNSGAGTISIDVPSGLFMDASSLGNVIVRAHFTLTFEVYKLALLMAENAPYIGEVKVLPIGLHPAFANSESSPYQLTLLKGILNIFKKRSRFAHKGTYGHALLIGGSLGKTGAIVLSAKAALRSGVGLLTVYVPQSSYAILQTSVPEAMTLLDAATNYVTSVLSDLQKYKAIGIGPGLGTEAETKSALQTILQQVQNGLVLDADALNCLAQEKHLLEKLPQHTILTPHPKEAERLFGASQNDFERLGQVQQYAIKLNCIVVLKGHHTFIALPNGEGFFNSTGNAGMAKGGSGDVLTGIITSLLAQGYAPEAAAILGVYLHGFAGDLAATALSAEAMLPSDLIKFLAPSFKSLNKA